MDTSFGLNPQVVELIQQTAKKPDLGFGFAVTTTIVLYLLHPPLRIQVVNPPSLLLIYWQVAEVIEMQLNDGVV